MSQFQKSMLSAQTDGQTDRHEFIGPFPQAGGPKKQQIENFKGLKIESP